MSGWPDDVWMVAVKVPAGINAALSVLGPADDGVMGSVNGVSVVSGGEKWRFCAMAGTPARV